VGIVKNETIKDRNRVRKNCCRASTSEYVERRAGTAKGDEESAVEHGGSAAERQEKRRRGGKEASSSRRDETKANRWQGTWEGLQKPRRQPAVATKIIQRRG
jgi:hypothetical protein